MLSERIAFTGHNGDQLAARLDMPDGPHLGTALFAHCFTCSKDIPAARRIAARLASMGLAVLRFDFTGLGHSGGEFANTSFTSNVDDLLAAAAYLDARDMAPNLLIGHSLGGAAVLRVAASLPSVKAVATIGAPFDPAHVTHNFADALDKIEAEGQAEVTLGGRPFTIGRDFVRDIKAENLAPAIANLKRALLVLHAPGDTIVGIENASQIFLAAKHPKSFVTLDDADHLISRASDAEYAAEVIAAWLARYLDIETPKPPKGAPERHRARDRGRTERFFERHKRRPLAPHPGRRTRGLRRHQPRHDALRLPRRRARRLHLDDHPDVRATQEMAADRHQRRCHPRQSPRPGRSRWRHHQSRPVHAPDPPDRRSGPGAAPRLLEIADKCPVPRTLEKSSVVNTSLA